MRNSGVQVIFLSFVWFKHVDCDCLYLYVQKNVISKIIVKTVCVYFEVSPVKLEYDFFLFSSCDGRLSFFRWHFLFSILFTVKIIFSCHKGELIRWCSSARFCFMEDVLDYIGWVLSEFIARQRLICTKSQSPCVPLSSMNTCMHYRVSGSSRLCGWMGQLLQVMMVH